jgi:hypothetical protein
MYLKEKGEHIMATENTHMAADQKTPATEQPAWYEYWLNLFKKLLELSNFKYGTKKNF